MHRLAAPAFSLLLLSAALARADAAAPAQAPPAQAADHGHADHAAHAGQAPATQARPTAADVQTKEVTYKQGDTELQGFLAWNTKAKGKRPGVLVVHEWWGHNEHARNQAKRLAEAGYVGFALDMYGKGKVATHPPDAQKFMAEATRDPAVVKARFEAALDVLKKDAHVDPEKLAAIGYCFGGAVVLSMARMGADLDAVASFHGALGQLPPPVQGGVKARVLVLNGAEDPMVTKEQIAAFEKDMAAAGAKFELVNLKGAKHSFTNPDAAKAGMDALAYDAQADKESWQRLLKLLREVFPS
jgi:dienelactone hydrolase